MSKNIVIIGAGPGGYVAAIRAAQLGNSVTLVEKENPGGTCLNWGCIPSKIMKASSELYSKTDHFEDFGIILTNKPEFSMEKLQEKKKKIVDIQINGIKSLLDHNNIKTVYGTAVFASENQIEINDKDNNNSKLNFDSLIIATGTEIKPLNGFEFDGENILSSNDLLSLTYIPESIAIIGGGIIGCEFASILSGLGTQVHIIEAEERILPIDNLDKEITKNLEREFKKKKIKIHKNSFAQIKEKDKNGFTIITKPKDSTSKEKEIKVSKIAVCTGRNPCTDSMGLETAGIETDDAGYIKTDENYETTCKNIFAIGDVLGPEYSMLAHTASFEGRICAEKISGDKFTSIDYSKIPSAIFTSPEIGFIGLTEESAAEKGYEPVKEKVLFRTSGKAMAIGEIAGEAIIIADKNTKIILGIHIIGPHASDLLGEAAVAVQKNTSFEELANIVHAHPTLSEVIMETGLKLSNMGLHG
jgi:dihydrolipoamide dehydrogenase